jgi:hypothetical protein
MPNKRDPFRFEQLEEAPKQALFAWCSLYKIAEETGFWVPFIQVSSARMQVLKVMSLILKINRTPFAPRTLSLPLSSFSNKFK